ncbi:5'-deoxyribonucleotide monophosphatase [Salmonella phage S124]|uniref:5'-deoxyribonucleotide monophosphatase n=1 Tax=Salmonella phage S124 TaxID=2231351 RepID=A0A2Z5HSJ9_9CAUD|nr:5'-deoxyribonucleotide monophosphatase [Salmonella phage S124]AXC43201.1 5'-deoxyribonucleotide monophosphatase [Salmonella phage S124]
MNQVNMNITRAFPHISRVMIWDLDGTIINSFHRVAPCFDDNGNLDLVKYSREACKHDLIMQDSLLPLVEYMRQCMNDANTLNIICTARLMSKSDYFYLRKQGLRGRGNSNIRVFSRDTLHKYFEADKVSEIYHSKDAVYKSYYFELFKQLYPNADFTMIDDHKGVLSAAASAGFKTLDAQAVNDILSIGVTLIGETFIDESLDDDNDYQFLAQRLEMCWQGMTDEERSEYSYTPQQFIDKLKVA